MRKERGKKKEKENCFRWEKRLEIVFWTLWTFSTWVLVCVMGGRWNHFDRETLYIILLLVGSTACLIGWKALTAHKRQPDIKLMQMVKPWGFKTLGGVPPQSGFIRNITFRRSPAICSQTYVSAAAAAAIFHRCVISVSRNNYLIIGLLSHANGVNCCAITR